MSKPIQTVEELDAVLHWRGKHAQAIRERDALQQDLNQRDEQIATLDLQREAHLRNSQVAERRVGVLEGLLREVSASCALIFEDHDATAETLDLQDRIDAALKPAEGAKPATCTWSHDGIGIWSGSCGTKWAFTDDGPIENGMHFCYSCGKTLVVEEAGAETEKDDDWSMNPCKQGHRYVGAAGGVAACNACDEKIEAPTTQEAFEHWNATHPKL